MQVLDVSQPIDVEYMELLRYILNNGVEKPSTSTGVTLHSVFGVALNYKVDPAAFPILTIKKINFKALCQELQWYISGEGHINNLRKQTKVWDAWADEDGGLESAYGRFWRKFPISHHPIQVPIVGYDKEELESEKVYVENGEVWPGLECEYLVYDAGGRRCFDQLRYVVDTLITNPNSGRIVMTAWHPANACVSYLPPCHMTIACNVLDGTLNFTLLQRRGDVPVGIPWNITCYSLLLLLLAKTCNLKPGNIQHVITDAHIYEDQLEAVVEVLKREPKELPRIELDEDVSVFNFTPKSVKLVGYDPHPFIKTPVAVHKRN